MVVSLRAAPAPPLSPERPSVRGRALTGQGQALLCRACVGLRMRHCRSQGQTVRRPPPPDALTEPAETSRTSRLTGCPRHGHFPCALSPGPESAGSYTKTAHHTFHAGNLKSRKENQSLKRLFCFPS